MRLLMVCLGNICRSPLAEGIMKAKAKKYNMELYVDSAGTAAYHIGNKPDPRSQEIALKNSIDLNDQRARQFKKEDFGRFDKIFAMDQNNYSDIVALANDSKDIEKVDLILNYAFPGENRSVPDPYYGGSDGFEKVYNMLDKACEIVAKKISEKTL
jgi:protein-tyrosine phosphatase